MRNLFNMTVTDDQSFIELLVDDATDDENTLPIKSVRLDQYVALKVPNLSRSRIQQLIEDEAILVDSKPTKASLKLRGGEQITITLPDPVELDLKPEDVPLEVVYQDEYLAVINKPAGMVTHPGAGVYSGTLVNALLHHMRGSLSGISGTIRPGIVHRLDKDTSGLLVIAKEDTTHRHLAEQIKAKTAHRRYIALLEGVMNEDKGVVDRPIGRHPTKRKQMAVVTNGRQAVSAFQVLKRFSRYTLVAVDLKTGRTHQIRVHMASLGFPVVGDLLYNTKSTGNLTARQKLGLIGHGLHAAHLSFTHPITGMVLEFEARLPDDFQALLESIQ